MGITWISEGERLPPIGQPVFLMAPRQSGELWDVSVAMLLVHYEGVNPQPVQAGSRWPTEYHWSRDRSGHDVLLVTGNGWWASMDEIPLPPLAAHRNERGGHYIAQTGRAFIDQKASP